MKTNTQNQSHQWETRHFCLQLRIWEPCLTRHRKLLSGRGELYETWQHIKVMRTRLQCECDWALRYLLKLMNWRQRGWKHSHLIDPDVDASEEKQQHSWGQYDLVDDSPEYYYETGLPPVLAVHGEWVLEYLKCFWLHVSINMERGRERERTNDRGQGLWEAMQVTPPQQSWETSEDCGKKLEEGPRRQHMMTPADDLWYYRHPHECCRALKSLIKLALESPNQQKAANVSKYFDK